MKVIESDKVGRYVASYSCDSEKPAVWGEKKKNCILLTLKRVAATPFWGLGHILQHQCTIKINLQFDMTRFFWIICFMVYHEEGQSSK
jgi:hypothetical protein